MADQYNGLWKLVRHKYPRTPFGHHCTLKLNCKIFFQVVMVLPVFYLQNLPRVQKLLVSSDPECNS